jgi:hypothetical protein
MTGPNDEATERTMERLEATPRPEGPAAREPADARERGGLAARHGTLRLLLLGILSVGLAGTAGELVLLEHTESVWQLIPLVLIPAALVALVAFAFFPGRVTLRAFQAAAALLVVAGGLGLWLHYQGNAEFELEMAPTLSGMALFTKALMGATPALAPGSMAQLGLVGLAATFRHPIGRR